MKDLERHVIKEVDPAEYYSREIGWGGEQKMQCPFHKETKPSFEIRSSDGSAYCYGCRTYVRSIVMFHMLFHKVNRNRALFQIFDLYLEPLVARNRYLKLIRHLNSKSKPFKTLLKRGIGPEIIRKFMLGYNGERLSIPIFNEWGYCVNIRLYDYTGKQDVKTYSFKKGYGKTRLYPMVSLASKDVIIFEGEMDTLLAIHHGFSGVTLTGGAGSWKPRFARYFRGKNVTICMDNDEAGIAGGRVIRDSLKHVCNSLTVLNLPKKYGKDFSDYMQHVTIEDFKALVVKAPHSTIDKRENYGDQHIAEKGMVLSLDKDKEVIHLIIKVEGQRK